MEVVVFNVQKFSTEDGPGIRSTVFFKGCPMRCPWCHNPESQRVAAEVVWHGGRCLSDLGCVEQCPQSALQGGAEGIHVDRDACDGCGTCVEYCPSSALERHGRKTTVEEVFEQVARDRAFYAESGGGVTLSGGEPLSQPKAALALLGMLRNTGIRTALDTCGAVSSEALSAALDLTDLVLFDVKTVDPDQHAEWTGIPFERVARSAGIVRDSGLPVWVRTPVIPGYTDDESVIWAVARYVAGNFPNCARHDLLAFSNLCAAKYAQLGRPWPFEETALVAEETMERLCAVAKNEGSLHAQWSGPTRLEEAGSASHAL